MPDVYDKEKEQTTSVPGQHDDLGVHPERREAEIADLESGLNGSAADEPDIKSAEQSGATGTSSGRAEKNELDRVGSGYREEGMRKSGVKRPGNFVVRNRNKLIGGGLLGGGFAGLIIGVLLLLPLKVQHVVNNLQQHFFSSSEQATQDMTDKLLRSYLVNKVMPGMVEGKCTSTKVTKSCAKITPGTGLVASLYVAWRDANFENKLATKHGIVIERYGGNKFKLITPSTLKSGGFDLGSLDTTDPGGIDRKLFTAMDRSGVRREIRNAFESETFAKRLMYRYKVGRFVERKYGVNRCLIACDARDRLSDNVDAKKRAWKNSFIDRVVLPRNEMMGIAMRCAINGFKCTETPTDADQYGERPSEFETETRAILAQRRTQAKTLDDIDKQAEQFNEKGFSTVLLEKMIGETATQVLKKGIPIVGWIDLGAHLFNGAANAGPAAQKINYVMNSQAMTTTYMMYRSNADEVKTGEIDATMLGSVTSSLNQQNGADQNGVGAEATPLYKNLMGTTTSSAASIFSGFIPHVSAAGTGYTCDGGAPVDIDSGELVCPEEKLDTVRGATKAANGISLVANSGPLAPLQFAADFWTSTAGRLLDVLGDGLGKALGFILGPFKHLPGVDTVINQGEKVVGAISEWFIGWFVNNPIGENPSGGRNFDMAAGGADVLGNDFAHYGLGGKQISQSTADAIRLQRETEDYESYMGQSFFARTFDTTSKHSLVSKVAVALPGSTVGSVSQSFARSLSTPFSMATTMVSTSKPVNAATKSEDPFGVTQYGYDANDPVFNTDPEKYWIEHDCGNPDKIKEWGEQSQLNPDTSMPEHSVTFGCKLLEASIGMAGGRYSDSVLTSEDLGDSSSDSSTGGGTALRIATYNVLGHSHTVPGGDRPTMAASSPRMERTVKVIRENGFDVVGLQEFEGSQRQDMMNLFNGEYRIYPEKSLYSSNEGRASSNSIIWKADRFDKVGAGTRPFKYFDGNDNLIPWVKLQDRLTGQVFIVSNTHDPADTRRFPNQKQWRDYDAKLHLAWATESAAQGVPVFITGDYNSRFEPRDNDYPERDRLPYCIMTRSGVLRNAFDILEKKSGACPSNSSARGEGIDHIYIASKEASVSKWLRIKNADTEYASDHFPVYTDVSIGGSGKVGTSVMGDDYRVECRNYGPSVTCSNQCVDFVKFRLKKHIDRNKFNDFTSGTGGIAAYTSSVNLGRLYGYKVDKVPAVHAVVSWPAGGVPGNSANSTYGHVAMVAQVNSDGSIVVEEYNYIAEKYGVRRIPADAARQLTYAHTEVDYK